ncbi:MAG: isoamylase early set domain-containing protein [Gemmatimonadales bacterium]
MSGRRLDELVATLRTPVPADQGFERRVIARIERARVVRRRWQVASGIATALLVALLARQLGGDHPTRVRFAFDAPAAASVTLVGDFNDWDRARTPLERRDGDRWEITLPLRSGVYRFAYLVDGETWAADPKAGHAPGDGDFGEPVSLLAVE